MRNRNLSLLGILPPAALFVACVNPVRTQLDAISAEVDLTRTSPRALLAEARRTSEAGLEAEQKLVIAELLRRQQREPNAVAEAGLLVVGMDSAVRWVEAARIRISGLSQRYARAGVGLPISLERAAAGATETAAKTPPEGDYLPATAVLSFPGERCAVLSVLDSRRFEAVSQRGHDVPLAADFTAPYARLLASARLLSTGRAAVLRPFSEERQGLFLLEPYDPQRIPLVMVHGLGSSPIAWRELSNAVFGSPVLRRRYQVWHYFYPTGLPYLWAGREFRHTLRRALAEVAAEARHPLPTDVVLVGHSMGGLLAKTAVSRSGETLWDSVFRVPPDVLDVSPADLDILREIFVFEPLPFVRRAVFVMSPHRGSDTAERWWARLGNRLVSLPERFTDLFQRVAEAHPEGIQPEFLTMFRSGGPSSVRALRSDHPLFPTLAEIPIADDVPFHSVIGDRGDGSDGVVTLESAVLEGAESTAIVEAGHREMDLPLVTNEIVAVLRRHVEDRPAPRDRSYTAPSCDTPPTLRDR
jgi:pimeloyl-ACP methyl ester carboxylesterase